MLKFALSNMLKIGLLFLSSKLMDVVDVFVYCDLQFVENQYKIYSCSFQKYSERYLICEIQKL